MRHSDPRLSRRRLLSSGSVLLGAALVAACAPAAAPSPTAAPAAAPTQAPAAAPTTAPAPTAAPTQAPAPTTAPAATPTAQAAAAAPAKSKLTLIGWNYEPPLVQQNIDRFKQQNPDLDVDYQAISGEYLTALIPKFQAKTPFDIVYVRDQYLAGWVDAQYLKPVDDFPEWKDLWNDIYGLNQDQSTYKGKHWGTFYYTDFDVLAYNDNMIKKAGFDKPPQTLDELKEQSLKLKKDGIVEFPLEVDWTKGSDSMWDYWMFVFASGGHLLDETGQPTYPEKDPVPLQILEWWVS